jgi:hypothetical protein
MRERRGRELAGLAAAATLSLCACACGSSSSSPSTSSPASAKVPAGAIAVIAKAPNGTVSKADYENALAQAVPRLGLHKLPARSTPQFAQVKDAAVSDLVLARWLEGEASERGITVSPSQIRSQLRTIIETQFGNSRQKYTRFLQQSHFSKADALERVRLQLLSTQLQQQVLPTSSKLPAKQQQKLAKRFEDKFVHKWRSRTLCAPAYKIDRCSNGPQPSSSSTSGGSGLGP